MRATAYPEIDELRKSLLDPADPDWITGYFEDRA
jgi:hypothetical protein